MNKRPQRKADRVAEALMRGIVSGERAVGDLLPREADLAIEFGVNRSVVREAVKLLEVHGLARPVRRRGTEVLDPLASVSPGVIRMMLSPGGGAVDGQMLADFLEVRATLDIEMSGLAARRRTDEDIDALRRAVAEVRASIGDSARFVEHVAVFTQTVARATHNRLYLMLVHWQTSVLDELQDLMAAVQQPSEPHVQGVELLFECVSRGDVEMARKLAESFHAWSTPRMLAAAALRSGEPLSRLLEAHRVEG